MTVRERMKELKTEEEVRQFLQAHPTAALFKAGGCHKTMQGFGYVEMALMARADLPLGYVKVIEWRPASNYIAEVTSVVHQSPQFILMVDGVPMYDVDNWDITLEVVEEALNRILGPAAQQPQSASCSKAWENIEPYCELLKAFTSGAIDEETFTERWLSLFQMDSTPRSSEEFALLDSLFGDVDQAICARAAGGESCSTQGLAARAFKLQAKLGR